MPAFHSHDVPQSAPENARFHVIPVPYEKTVSYGHGTADGPLAILEASRQLETFDGHSTPSDYGIHTFAPVDCSGSAEIALANIRRAVASSLAYPNTIPCVIGGEHTITSAVVAAFAEKYGTKNIGVVHFDAHCDLRDEYDGTKWSHACVMRRVHETGVALYQIGTRSYCVEERDYRAAHAIPHIDAEDFCRLGPDEAIKLPNDFPGNIFISFDIDALDSSVMPATGTPCPGGLIWWDTMRALEIVTRSRCCVGFDLVEFAPLKSLHYADFAAAQLVYNIMGLVSRTRA
jgi:agmatinase